MKFNKLNNLKIAIWMNFPSHHQSDFFSALRSSGVELRVYYYDKIPESRIRLGWHKEKELPEGEYFIKELAAINEILEETKEFVHIVPPSLGSKFIRKLLHLLIKFRFEWLIWSEPLKPSLRTLLIKPFKRRLGFYVNCYGLGALAIGRIAIMDFLKWGINPVKIGFLPYAVSGLPSNIVEDEACMQFRNGRKSFLFLGSLCRRKGTDLLIKSWAEANAFSSDKKWFMILCGNDSSNGYYRNLAIDLGIADTCLFREAVHPEEIPHVLKSADVVVLPSRYDGWGVVLNEAASVGKAMIATDKVGAAYHLLENGYNGFMVKAGDKKSLTGALVSYMENPELPNVHGEKSKLLFHEFTPENNALRLIAYLESFRVIKKSIK
jgi:glycosyltransferase involved in cell wall biosynthesis